MTATRNPRHHPPCDLLRAYASCDRQDEGTHLFIAAHLSLCPACRQKLQGYEAKAGIKLEDMPPEAMDVTCLENLLMRIEEHGPPACIDVTIPPLDIPASFIPEALQEYLGMQLDEFLWRRESAAGVFVYHQTHITLALPPNLRLLRLKTGARITLGRRSLLVLDGVVQTLFGSYEAGDVLRGGFFSTLFAQASREALVLVIG